MALQTYIRKQRTGMHAATSDPLMQFIYRCLFHSRGHPVLGQVGCLMGGLVGGWLD